MNETIQFLKQLQEELRMQETDSQASPRFWVIADYYWVATETDSSIERIMVYDHGSAWAEEISEFISSARCDQIEDDESFLTFLDELDELSSKWDYSIEDVRDLVERYGYDFTIYGEMKQWRIVQDTMFLTKNDAQRHLAANAHNYSPDAHTYAMTAFRSPTVERLLNILEHFNWDNVSVGE